jgi:hypothetical protein
MSNREIIDSSQSSGGDSNNAITMKEVIELQNKMNQKIVKEYCQQIQYQNMVLCKLRYQKEVYA